MTDATKPHESQLPILVRDMEIDDLAPVFHLGETLFTSDLYPYILPHLGSVGSDWAVQHGL